MQKKNNIIQLMTEVAIMAAIGFVLDELQSVFLKGIFFNGGSIGIAMVPVLFMAFRRGAIPAIFTGLIIGSLDLLTSAYIVHPFQIFLDYVFPYALVGFAGLTELFFDSANTKWTKVLYILLGTFIGASLKLLSHYLSGVMFFVTSATDLWGMPKLNPHLFSFLYNFAFTGPSAVLSFPVMMFIFLKAPKLLEADRFVLGDSTDDRDAFAYISSSTFVLGGGFLFVFYLIKYILSFSKWEGDGSWGYDFDGDCMLIFVLGLFTLLIGIQSLIRIYKQKHSNTFSMGVFTAITLASLIYGVARLIKMINKGKDPTTYIIWAIVGTVTLILSIILCVIAYKKRNVRVPRSA